MNSDDGGNPKHGLRSLHVVPTYFPAVRYGGPIESVHSLCAALYRAGASTGVVTTNVDGALDSNVALEQPVEMDGVRVWYSRSRMGRRLYFSPGLGRRLNVLVPSAGIVHLHSVFLWPTWKAARVARRCGVPYVVSPRGMLVPELVSARSAFIKRAWIALIERRNLRGAAAIHVTSAVEQRDLERMNLGPLPPVRVIPNGVRVETSPAVARDLRRVVFLGRLSWKKGLDRLIRAVTLVPDVRLDIAGPDDEMLLPALKELCEQLDVRDRVRFLGAVQGVPKAELLARAGVLVLPSLSENFGNVVIEALMHSCPVIVTPGVGAREIVEACRGGLVADGDPQALAAALREVLRDPEAQIAMGARGREYVLANLSWDAIARRMLALYEEFAEGAKRVAHAR